MKEPKNYFQNALEMHCLLLKKNIFNATLHQEKLPLIIVPWTGEHVMGIVCTSLGIGHQKSHEDRVALTAIIFPLSLSAIGREGGRDPCLLCTIT